MPASVKVPAAEEDVGSVQESPAPEAKACHCPKVQVFPNSMDVYT